MTTDQENAIEGLIDLKRVHDDIAVLDDEITELENQQQAIQNQLTNCYDRRRLLHDFIRLTSYYRAKVGLVALKPVALRREEFVKDTKAKGKGRRASDRSLVRAPDQIQTKMANILVADFKPGDVFELSTALSHLREFIPEDQQRPSQWIGTYIARETAYQNGILEMIKSGQYRMRENAKTILETAIAAQQQAAAQRAARRPAH